MPPQAVPIQAVPIQADVPQLNAAKLEGQAADEQGWPKRRPPTDNGPRVVAHAQHATAIAPASDDGTSAFVYVLIGCGRRRAGCRRVHGRAVGHAPAEPAGELKRMADAMSAIVSRLDGVKGRQQRMWASGDYAAVAARIHPMAERLCESADLVAGTRVLDVATGSGNAAIAAARRDCDVVGIDYVAALLGRADVRARAEGLEIELLEADAEALPFGDASFDAVLSVVGVMFAPNQEQAAAELVRGAVPAERSRWRAGPRGASSASCCCW